MPAYRLPRLLMLCLSLIVFHLAVPPARAAQAPDPARAQAQTAYIAAFRTPAHVTRSSPEVFHGAVDSLLDLFKSKNVILASDPARPMIQTEETMPRETLLNLAKDAGAAYLLVLTVDRPAVSWLKISIQCFSVSGASLWEEHASYGGGLSGGKALADVLKKLERQLAPRFGQPGLPTGVGSTPQE
jgi:hypothetical protein